MIHETIYICTYHLVLHIVHNALHIVLAVLIGAVHKDETGLSGRKQAEFASVN